MILGQVSYLDCVVFLLFLAPQLLLQVGLWTSFLVALRALPFLVQLPFHFIWERYFVRTKRQTPFVRQATPFQDFVIRCVRYAFAEIPAGVGRVFFSKRVALPFMRFRMLRHGYLRSPTYWRETAGDGFNGIWMVHDPLSDPDIIIYYCHGGGFSMGSSYFYLEFLLAWLSLLHTSAGYRNPAILALEYTLVPDAVFPTQLHQVIAGYTHLLSLAGDDASRICVSGDSAGATLILSLLLHLGRAQPATEKRTATPGFATLISPWVTLVSAKNRNTRSDYLNADSLHLYARQYSGPNASLDDPMVSPGKCKDVAWWRRAAPQNGLFILYGAEEVLAPEMEELIRLLDRADVSTVVREEEESIHAWPVATLFLGESKAERQKGLRDIVKVIGERMR